MSTDDGLDTIDKLQGELARCQNNIAVLRNSIFVMKNRGIREQKQRQLAEAQQYEAQLQRRISRREREERNK